MLMMLHTSLRAYIHSLHSASNECMHEVAVLVHQPTPLPVPNLWAARSVLGPGAGLGRWALLLMDVGICMSHGRVHTHV